MKNRRTLARVQENDDLCTPQYIIDRALLLGPIALDPCSNEWSIVPAKRRISKHDGGDGLAVCWADIVEEVGGGTVWHNPVYSTPKPWAEKAVAESRNGAEVLSLLRYDPSVEVYQIIRQRMSAIARLVHRVPFIGGKHGSGAIASVVYYMGERPHLFCHAFQDVADVQVFDRPRRWSDLRKK